MMDYWGRPGNKDERAFSAVAEFVKNGGHLVVFGCVNGRNMANLRPFGIVTGASEDFAFEETGLSKLFLKGSEAAVPSDRHLRSYGSLKCTVPHFPLLKRSTKGDPAFRKDPAVATLTAAAGRVTVTMVEPGPTLGGRDDSAWLIGTMVSWIARGCPVDPALAACRRSCPRRRTTSPPSTQRPSTWRRSWPHARRRNSTAPGRGRGDRGGHRDGCDLHGFGPADFADLLRDRQQCRPRQDGHQAHRRAVDQALAKAVIRNDYRQERGALRMDCRLRNGTGGWQSNIPPSKANT